MAKWLLDVIVMAPPVLKSPQQYGQAERETKVLREKGKKAPLAQKKENEATFGQKSASSKCSYSPS